VALAIAGSKAVLIMLYFMHLRYSNRLTSVFAVAGFLWLAILIALCLSDYLTRGLLGIDGK
jgi:cytochrome c oxidase subunit 4